MGTGECLKRLERLDEANGVCGALGTLFDDERAIAMKQDLSRPAAPQRRSPTLMLPLKRAIVSSVSTWPAPSPSF